MPFSFGDEPVNAGDMISAQCSVNKGDLPIVVNWYFNNKKINDMNFGISTSKSSNRINLLSIESIKAEHGGLYTCLASNKAGIANYSSTLVVNGILFLFGRLTH